MFSIAPRLVLSPTHHTDLPRLHFYETPFTVIVPHGRNIIIVVIVHVMSAPVVSFRPSAASAYNSFFFVCALACVCPLCLAFPLTSSHVIRCATHNSSEATLPVVWCDVVQIFIALLKFRVPREGYDTAVQCMKIQTCSHFTFLRPPHTTYLPSTTYMATNCAGILCSTQFVFQS